MRLIRYASYLAILSTAALLGSAPLSAAPPDVPKELKVDVGQVIRIVAKGDKVGTARNFPDDAAFFDELAPQPGTKRYMFQATKPGTYVIAFWTPGEDYGVTTTITVGTPPPPVPPIPPGPQPDPSSPAPIPATGFRVLIVYNAATQTTIPAAQQEIIYGQKFRDYMDSRCVVGPDGKQKEWRIYPDTVSTTGESALWQAAMKRPRGTVPTILISNGVTGYEGPLPASVDDAIALLKKY